MLAGGQAGCTGGQGVLWQWVAPFVASGLHIVILSFNRSLQLLNSSFHGLVHRFAGSRAATQRVSFLHAYNVSQGMYLTCIMLKAECLL
jgi:hypothetical protein